VALWSSSLSLPIYSSDFAILSPNLDSFSSTLASWSTKVLSLLWSFRIFSRMLLSSLFRLFSSAYTSPTILFSSLTTLLSSSYILFSCASSWSKLSLSSALMVWTFLPSSLFLVERSAKSVPNFFSAVYTSFSFLVKVLSSPMRSLIYLELSAILPSTSSLIFFYRARSSFSISSVNFLSF